MTGKPELLRIHASKGSPHRLLVACPQDHEPVLLERCLACTHGEGDIEIHGRREAYVRCRPDDVAPRGRRASQVPISEVMTTKVVSDTRSVRSWRGEHRRSSSARS